LYTHRSEYISASTHLKKKNLFSIIQQLKSIIISLGLFFIIIILREAKQLIVKKWFGQIPVYRWWWHSYLKWTHAKVRCFVFFPPFLYFRGGQRCRYLRDARGDGWGSLLMSWENLWWGTDRSASPLWAFGIGQSAELISSALGGNVNERSQ
jgi:hypothetical protein